MYTNFLTTDNVLVKVRTEKCGIGLNLSINGAAKLFKPTTEKSYHISLRRRISRLNNKFVKGSLLN